MKRIALDDLTGKRVVFASGNECRYGQDFQQWIGMPTDVVFTVNAVWQSDNKIVWLVAPGYGGKPYGNGRICVHHTDFWKWAKEAKGVDEHAADQVR